MDLINRISGDPVPTIGPLELQEKLKDSQDLFLLDVRQPEEFRSSHIAGAKLIPLDELSGRVHEIPKDREIVCICATGQRSVPAARILKDAGYVASSLENGMIAWQTAKLPTLQGS